MKNKFVNFRNEMMVKQKVFILLILGLFTTIITQSCSDDNSIKLSQNSCVLTPENYHVAIDILTEGTGYIVKSSNIQNVEARVINNKLVIGGKGNGRATVTITDNENRSASVRVSIEGLIYTPSILAERIWIKKGTTKSVKSEFSNGKYSIYNLSPDVAVGKFENPNITVSGINLGTVDFEVLDSTFWTVRVYKISVIESYDLSLSNDQLSVDPSSDNNIFYIFSGNGGYTIKVSDESLATAEILPYDHNRDDGFIANPAKIRVKPLKNSGDFTLTITDADNKSKTIKCYIW